MICSKCGADNAEGSAFCSRCGNSFTAQAASPQSSQQSAAPPANSPQQRNPIAAAVLNFFFGLGYVYLGYNKVMGLQTILFVVAMIVVYFLLGIFTVGLVSLVVAVVLALDGYQKGSGQKGFITVE